MRILIARIFSFVALTASTTAQASPPTFLDQGWSDALREQFYYTSQGSHMIPAEWFAVLERPDGHGRFADHAFLETFGFLTADRLSALNPEGYPIGFTVEAETNQLGLTCAACHTANVTVNGVTVRIDGAPAHLDFDTFYQTLSRAVTMTLQMPYRFERFATSLGAQDDAAVAVLKGKLAAFNLRLTADVVLRRPTVASGFGRVDALTQIVNSLAVRDQGDPQNLYPVTAPTSYPPLWLSPDLEFVQWNPIASSPIIRNGGQVLGVFGNANLSATAGVNAFQSTILLNELHEMEQWLEILAPPKWDEQLMGLVDAAKAKVGKALFAASCSGCHNMVPYRRTDPARNHFGKTFIEIGRVDFRMVGTDPSYSRALLARRVATNPTTAPVFGNASIVPAPAFFAGMVGATLRRSMDEAGLSTEQKFALNGFRFRTGDDGKPVPYQPPRLTDLKASPLAGVWATGPYLHNGSVPTIYEMLSPPADRSAVFWTGSKKLDLDHLGYTSDEAPGLFRFDTSLPGNGNGGHHFPPQGLDHDERMAVIEYLKTQ